jgi:hypothetical protein
MVAGSRVAAAINDRMTALWKASFNHIRAAPAIPPTNMLTVKQQILRGLRSGWKDYIGPALSAVVICYLGFTLFNRLTFTVLDQAGLVCAPSAELEKLEEVPADGVLLSFDSRNSCFASGYKVEHLKRYFVWTSPKKEDLDARFHNYRVKPGACTAASDEKFLNGSVETDARGYGVFRNAEEEPLGIEATIWNMLLLPLRRHYGEPWFQPVARYGETGSEFEFLKPDLDPNVEEISEVVRPKVPGELFFYFNDAVTAVPTFQPFYRDNRGCATFFVMKR